MHHVKKTLLVSIVGPTAVGKTDMAIKIAQRFRTVIISADSRQFYRELNIGTAKPNTEELNKAAHYFINSHSINENYNAGAFGRDALELIKKLSKKYELIVVVGGSTLYLKALWEGFDEMPEAAEGVRESLNKILEKGKISDLLVELKRLDPAYYNKVDRNNGQRVVRALEIIRSTGKPYSSFRLSKEKDLPYQNLKVGLNIDRKTLFEKINKRMDVMIDKGLFQEAESLMGHKNHNALQTVGYSEIFEFIEGSYDREETIRLLKRNSRRYAKRQLTWFNRYDDIHWFKPDKEDEVIKLIIQQLSEH
ncbi:MAG: tRNA (adenosine(37)-N6)-dimethylallyltransferase MiaA [Ekhidna sp.]|nr:tRNA (adenosine(37)-N6)-dimethylallyltransferase MiaA [Ekhidna sp.]